MSTNSNLVEIVQSMYAAFGRGDVPAILAQLRGDVDWKINVDPNAPGVSAIPMLRPCRGPAEVGGFFSRLAEHIEFHDFQPRSFMSGGREVAVRVWFDATVRSTGNRMKSEAIHHFTFDDEGKVARFLDCLDTLGEAMAWNAIQARTQAPAFAPQTGS